MNVWQFIAQNSDQVLHLTLEHLWLAGFSTFLAALVAIPLGILISRKPIWNRPVIGNREHYSDHPKPSSIRISAASSVDRRTRRRLAILGAGPLCTSPTNPQHLCRNQRRRSRSNRSGTRHGHDRLANPLASRVTVCR